MDARTLLNDENRSVRARAARTVLRPAGTLWRALGAARNALYTARIIRSAPLGAATVSVGNLSAGGTGKTPLVIEVVRRLRAAGHQPAVLHRGYGGRGGANDEHHLYEAAFGGEVPVTADPDRRAAAALTRQSHPEITVFVLDDGFQHRRAGRDLDLVLVDASAPLQNARVLPAGLLREGIGALRRADAIMITHVEQVTDDDVERLARFIAETTARAPLALTRHAWDHFVRIDESSLPVSTLACRRVVSACGIGNPGAFETMLRRHAEHTVAFHVFVDHHRFDRVTIQSLLDDAHRRGADTVVITEKDWMKWRPLLPHLRLRGLELLRPALAITFDRGESDFDALLRRRLPVPGKTA